MNNIFGVLFSIMALRNIDLPANHQLQQLQSVEDAVLNPSTFFEGKSLEEIKEILKKKTILNK